MITSFAKKPNIFEIFQGGGGPDPLSPPLDPHMWIILLQVDNMVQLVYTTYISVNIAHHEVFYAKVVIIKQYQPFEYWKPQKGYFGKQCKT